MTKKDYVLIAKDIKKAIENSKTAEQKEAIKDLALVFTLSFRVENIRFDDDGFLQACGIIG